MSESDYFTLFTRDQATAASAFSNGGYIITPEGAFAALDAPCTHFNVCMELYHLDECKAQELGIIRVSFAGHRDEVAIDWTRGHVTIPALQALRAILPKHPDRVKFTFSISGPDEASYCYRENLDLAQARGVITRAIAARMPAKAAA